MLNVSGHGDCPCDIANIARSRDLAIFAIPCDIFNLSSSHLNVARTTMHHLYNVMFKILAVDDTRSLSEM